MDTTSEHLRLASVPALLRGNAKAEIENVDRTVKRTYFQFRAGEFSGCNLFYLKSGKALNTVLFWHNTRSVC